MSQSANVTSIDAIKRIRQLMVKFDSNVRDALTQLSLECRRAVDWIDIDRPKYWQQQLHLALNQVAEARVNLERKQITVAGGDLNSLIDEKKAYEKARNRRRFTEERVRAVKQWQRKIRHVAEEFEVQIAKAADWAESDMPRAIATLDRMIRSLDKYTEQRPPTDVGDLPVETESTAGDEEQT